MRNRRMNNRGESFSKRSRDRFLFFSFFFFFFFFSLSQFVSLTFDRSGLSRAEMHEDSDARRDENARTFFFFIRNEKTFRVPKEKKRKRKKRTCRSHTSEEICFF